ncbi:[FeFe] hydrogenase H-cluster maturation GTPase HydF [Yeguia hominis]|uniref:[FeFe] hydrogenase H-cluster maturation GTPase HydF n=1 Tax=Yeguia hominis TaxID=2763662 RepID=A0A926HMI4_9FIRM|nr:[FeFe] hydrogenase H-cluster maturation GTPase HydF [Yeguia hominis]MBC8533162.1 [FeFe] hydrogenase H-cluster maturation GTPase HydF [Yeguia hominis]
MSLNHTPSAERVHIGFFGRRNAGKSSVVNAVTGQNLAIVSAVKGTTTDPVYKAMELLPMGPVMVIDTPGIDDEGGLGELRVQKSRQVIAKTDVAVLVVDAETGMAPEDEALLEAFRVKRVPYLIAYNKSDLLQTQPQISDAEHAVLVSAKTGEGIRELKERIAHLSVSDAPQRRIVGDLLSPSDLVVLVVPIDSAAPKGRLILPQQQTIRDILDADAVSVVVKETGLREALASLSKPPRLVITDSQAFAQVSKDTPPEIPLTSFSILFARYKGNLALAVQGARAIETIRDGSRILISEGCTHHRQCDDIGTVKLPRWIRKHTGCEPEFVFSSGTEFPEDLSSYQMVVHCGGCMLNEREMQSRLQRAQAQGVPVTNYGILIAYMTGILKRSVAPFPEIAALLDRHDKA